MPANITFRTSSLHGTGDEALKREHVKARKAIQAAIDAVKAVTVHGRDFLDTQGPNLRDQAQNEYRVHLQGLTNALNFVQAHELVHRGFDKGTVQELAEDLYQLT